MNSNSIVNNGNSFTSVDNLSLKHAKDHLNAFQNDINQVHQKDATINALDE
jgi:hypothetical protein